MQSNEPLRYLIGKSWKQRYLNFFSKLDVRLHVSYNYFGYYRKETEQNQETTESSHQAEGQDWVGEGTSAVRGERDPRHRRRLLRGTGTTPILPTTIRSVRSLYQIISISGLCFRNWILTWWEWWENIIFCSFSSNGSKKIWYINRFSWLWLKNDWCFVSDLLRAISSREVARLQQSLDAVRKSSRDSQIKLQLETAKAER